MVSAWVVIHEDEIKGVKVNKENFTIEEANYYDLIFDVLDDGIISTDERALLDKRKIKLAISSERALEIEIMAKSSHGISEAVDRRAIVLDIEDKSDLRVRKRDVLEIIAAWLPFVLVIFYSTSEIDLLKNMALDEMLFFLLAALYGINNTFISDARMYNFLIIATRVLLVLGGIPILLVVVLYILQQAGIEIIGIVAETPVELFKSGAGNFLNAINPFN